MEDLEIIEQKIAQLKKIFQYDDRQNEMKLIEEQMEAPDFWDDPKKAAQVQKRRRFCNQILEDFARMQQDVDDTREFAPLAEAGDMEIQKEIQTKIEKLKIKLDEMEFKRILGGEMDAASAIIEINSGAGGTESQDWVAILLRMYMRWAEYHKFQCEIVNELPGEGAGYKNVAITIEGEYATDISKVKLAFTDWFASHPLIPMPVVILPLHRSWCCRKSMMKLKLKSTKPTCVPIHSVLLVPAVNT
jgi:peptide chain release factor 2